MKSYRPRNLGHDYYGKGIYLITLVVSSRSALLGRLGNDAMHPEVILTPLGEMVRQEWNSLPEKQAAHGNNVAVHACVCMPDHFHGVIEVRESMHWSLGDIIQTFKAACTSFWQQQQGHDHSYNRPISVDCFSEQAPQWLREKAARYLNEGALIRALSKRQREQYYLLVHSEHRPLFDDNYDDTVCIGQRHREAMVAYVNDNPRRAILRRTLPHMMQRCLHVQIGEHDYGTNGNLLILAPWALESMPPVNGVPAHTDYSRFHNMNKLAAEICHFNGQAKIIPPANS